MAKVKAVQTSVVLDAAGVPVSGNPVLITYPTDTWGMMTDTKAALKYLAARIAGCPEKFQIAQDTLKIALEHIRIRYLEDRARLDAESELN